VALVALTFSQGILGSLQIRIQKLLFDNWSGLAVTTAMVVSLIFAYMSLVSMRVVVFEGGSLIDTTQIISGHNFAVLAVGAVTMAAYGITIAVDLWNIYKPNDGASFGLTFVYVVFFLALGLASFFT
jgi:hypothetical protein